MLLALPPINSLAASNLRGQEPIVEHLIFLLFASAGLAAFVSAPINPFTSGSASRRQPERGEIILLNDLHRTTFRRH
jgi:hypothetical protein